MLTFFPANLKFDILAYIYTELKGKVNMYLNL